MRFVRRLSTRTAVAVGVVVAVVVSMSAAAFGAPVRHDYVPKMPAATGPVDVADVSNDSAQAQMAARALEGIVNRRGARVYVTASPGETQWISRSQDFEHRGHRNLSSESTANPGLVALYARYGKRIRQFDVYDPAREWTFDLAMTAAGIGDGLPVDATLLHQIEGTFGPKKVVDYSGIGTDPVSGYQWALTHLMPHAGRSAVFVLGLRSDWQQGPWRLYDYATATRGFVFNLDWNDPAQQAVIRQIAAHYRPGTPMMGYSAACGDCGSSMAFTSGLYWYAADYFANGSLWSSFPSISGLRQRPARPVPTQAGKIYVTLYSSDGDNVAFDENNVPAYLTDPAVASVPQGYSIDPVITQLAPPMIEWMYRNLPDTAELVGGPGGLGYPLLDAPDDVYAQWVRDNGAAMNTAGLTTATLWNMGGSDAPRVAEYLHAAPTVTGVFLGYVNHTATITTYGGRQLAQNTLLTAAQIPAIQSDLESIAPDPAHPTFVEYQTLAATMTPTAVAQMITTLTAHYPGRFVFLTPKDYIATALTH